MKSVIDILRIFHLNNRVEERRDNNGNPCGYDVVMTVPESASSPEHDEIICFVPDGLGENKKTVANTISLVPEMLDRLGDHCEWCADCDWMHKPDQTCRFGELWKKIGGEE